MRISSLAKNTLCLVTAATMLAACGSGIGSALSPSALAYRSAPMMTPDVPHTKHTYQYFSTFILPTFFNGPGALQFEYPMGQTGQINDLQDANGECTNALYGTGKRNFWVVESGANRVDEFGYDPSTPIAVLNTVPLPWGCAIDPKTGDLAVTIETDGYRGEVVIFKHAKGLGKAIQLPLGNAYFDGYDPHGNLFVDGANAAHSSSALVEIPAGASSGELIKTNEVNLGGGVQWDGKYLAVTDGADGVIYRYTVKGTTATKEGSVSLSDMSDCVQTWITQDLVFCPDSGGSRALVYNYPAGGQYITQWIGFPPYGGPRGAVQVRQ